MRLNHLAALLVAVLIGCRAETFTSPGVTGLEVVVGPPTTVSLATELDTPLTVRVVDLDGDPVAGVAVAWRVIDGEGELIPTAAVSGPDGVVTARWKFSGLPGLQRAQAELEGADAVSFTTEAAGFRVVQVTAGHDHGCGIDSLGGAWCWSGDSIALGNLDIGSYTLRPTPVSGVPAFAEIRAMGSTTCGRTGLGAVWCWGYNWGGALGRGLGAGHSAVAAEVAGLPPIQHLAAGDSHSCGLTADSTAWCWGHNPFGGAGSVGSDGLAAPVSTAIRFTQLAAGVYHTCGLTGAGEAFCWGDNGSGQLGDAGSSRSAPTTPVGGGHQFVELTSTDQGTCGRTSAGEAWCWGRGVGTPEMPSSTGHPTPVKIKFSAPVAAIAGGSSWMTGVLLGGRLEVVAGGREVLWPTTLERVGVGQISGQLSFCVLSRSGEVYCSGEIVDQIHCSSLPPWGCAPTAAIPLPAGGRVYGYPPFGD